AALPIHAECRTNRYRRVVILSAGQKLDVGRACALRKRRNSDFRQNLARFDHSGEIPRSEIFDWNTPLTRLTFEYSLRTQGYQHGRRILGRIGVREIPTDRSLITYSNS